MTNIERTEKLRNELKPLYEKLLKNVAEFDYDKATFCLQWGENFPLEKHCGVMFAGRATNGWVTDCEDVDVLFGDSEDAIFNRHDQMKWVENLSGNTKGYNTRKSAFWRVIKKITKELYPEPWYSHVAWSNVCKVAPWKGGNPNDSLYYAQLSDCKKIFAKEIELLSPKVVVLFTGEEWAIDLLRYMNGEVGTKSIYKQKWANYVCKVYQINGVIYIRTEHPQGKSEDAHAQCIVDIVKRCNQSQV